MTKHAHVWRLNWVDRVAVCDICNGLKIDVFVEDMLKEHETLKLSMSKIANLVNDLDKLLDTDIDKAIEAYPYPNKVRMRVALSNLYTYLQEAEE